MSSLLADGVRHPKIYGYTVPAHSTQDWAGPRDGMGLIKIGYTDRDVHMRIREQLNPVKMPQAAEYELLFSESAVDDNGQPFSDHAVHHMLTANGVHRHNGEWFECTRDEALGAIHALKTGGAADQLRATVSFPMRPEQAQAVDVTAAYLTAHADDDNPPGFLWNAKMRFGKTFTTYQLAKKLGWTRVLVLTYKPAVEAAWREDLTTHADFTGWRFKGKDDQAPDLDDPRPIVWFASFQDVLGTGKDGQPKLKNEDLYFVDWDCVVIDEYHFGAWRDAARSLYAADKDAGLEADETEKNALDTPDLDDDFRDNVEASLGLDVANYLYLSGTPFRALTQGEFLEDQVFNWTYSDEQHAKENWNGPEPSPYAALPKMHLLVYEMPDKLREVAINNASEFSLTEFFATEDSDGSPKFVHEREVQKWLDLLRGQDITGLWANVANNQRPPLPYEDTNLLRALQHTVWYMPSVASCKAMRDLLTADHNTFYRDYQVIVAAGPGAGVGERAKPPVDAAIGKVPQDRKTITLSCGKLMTGVTVPAWTGIFMLRELKSPESYFQAAFRVQSPWATSMPDPVGGGTTQIVFKEHCYVLDFAPNRALTQVVDYATRLRADAASQQDKEAAVDEFMEFLPVLSFDGYGMKRLSAADVIDYLTSGVSASMLARRWNSPELITLDLRAMEQLLADTELLASLEQIEMFRDISNELTAMINTNKELRKKKVAKEPLDKDEKEKEKSAKKTRDDLRKKLQRFVTRIPAFMYLTDYREKTIKDIITQIEPDLFMRVTGLTLHDFERLVDVGVFNDAKMNDAVWKFRMFEEPSLHYFAQPEAERVGAWSITISRPFARLMDAGLLSPGDLLEGHLSSGETVLAEVSDDYGILVDGVRYESPPEAADAVAERREVDGWDFWTCDVDGAMVPLAHLAESLKAAGAHLVQ